MSVPKSTLGQTKALRNQKIQKQPDDKTDPRKTPGMNFTASIINKIHHRTYFLLYPFSSCSILLRR